MQSQWLWLVLALGLLPPAIVLRAADAADATGAIPVATASPSPTAFENAQEVYRKDGPKAALPLFQQARDAANGRGDRLGAAIAEGYVGNCYKRLGDYRKAREHLERALAVKRRLGAKIEAGKTLNHLGLLLWEAGDLDPALARFEQAIAIARAGSDRRLEAAVLNNTALVLDERGDFQRSRERYDAALAIFRALGDRPSEGAALGNIGGVHYLVGDFREGIARHGQALAIHRELGEKPAVSKDLANMALCHIWLDEIPLALELLDQALALATEAGLAKESADFQRFRGSALVRRGEFALALAAYREALAVYERAGMKREMVEVRIDAAHVRLELGETLATRDELIAAVSTSEQQGYSRGTIEALGELGELSAIAKNPAESARHFERALAVARKIGDRASEADLLLRLGRASIELGALPAARDSVRQSQALARKLELRSVEAMGLHAAGEIELRSGAPGAALLSYQKGLVIASALAAPELGWALEHGRGRALEALGRREEAVLAYRAAVDAIERGRGRLKDDMLRAGYLERRSRPYADLARLLLELGRLGEAFREIERGRARTHLDQIGRDAVLRRADSGATRRAEEHQLRRKLERLSEALREERAGPGGTQRDAAVRSFNHELATAERRYLMTLAELRSEDPGYAALVAVNPVELAFVQATLAGDEALVEYFMDDHNLHVLVVTQRGIEHAVSPIEPSALRARIELLRDRIAHGGDDWRRPAEGLWDVLVAPIEARVPNARRLYLVPQGMLHAIPFAALRERGALTAASLIERHEIAMLPSASLLPLLRERNRAKPTVIPASPNASARATVLALAPGRAGLEHANLEARAVERLLGGTALVGHDASESACKARARDFPVLHLATHGRLDALNPLFSHVELEPGAGEDGRLNVYEILDLDLRAELVTLSACNTALGVGHFRAAPEGDELVSLTRAFLEAGAASVAASLWEVDDRTTNEFMRRFYARLRTSGKAKGLALAQRELMGGVAGPALAHPRAWAGFVLVGDGG